MSLATDMRAGALSAIQELGSTATLVSRSATWDPATRKTTESNTETQVTISPLVDESKSYGPDLVELNVTGTFYVAAVDGTPAPRVNDRVVYGSGTYEILLVSTYELGGVSVAYRMDVAEVGA